MSPSYGPFFDVDYKKKNNKGKENIIKRRGGGEKKRLKNLTNAQWEFMGL